MAAVVRKTLAKIEGKQYTHDIYKLINFNFPPKFHFFFSKKSISKHFLVEQEI